MESLLGFEEAQTENEPGKSFSNGRKLVPWLTWNEWLFVYQSLFSQSSDSIVSALGRISTWRSRGCLPVVIEVTASIIEVQQKDPYFRDEKSSDALNNYMEDHPSEALLSEEMLAMLHCMAIMRLVNGVVEKMRKKTEVSIALAAAAINLPRILIDVRHEGSHRELPALQVVRSASVKALSWLKSYYWEPQKNAIPFQGEKSATIRKEIKIKLRQLALGLKIKQSPQCGTNVAKETSGRSLEWHCGRNKFLTPMSNKLLLSKGGGSKTKISKTLKTLMKLYSSFSLEFVSVLIEFLVKELSDDLQDHESTQSLLNDGELVITKIINAEPELLFVLLNTILEKIENRKTMKDETATDCLRPNSQISHLSLCQSNKNQIDSEEKLLEVSNFGIMQWSKQNFLLLNDRRLESCHGEHLSSLFLWLVNKLKGINHRRSRDSSAATKDSMAGASIPKDVITGLIRKCLQLSATGDNKLMDSALNLAQLMGDGSLMVKLQKFSMVVSADIHATGAENYSTLEASEDNFIHMEESIGRALQKLEMLKLQKVNSKTMNPADEKARNLDKWVVVRSWNPCPIGMLSLSLGSSGRLPDLDYVAGEGDAIDVQTSGWVENQEPNQLPTGKREASSEIQLLDNSNVKRRKETSEDCNSNGEDFPLFEGIMVRGGVLERVGEEQLLALKSAVRILV